MNICAKNAQLKNTLQCSHAALGKDNQMCLEKITYKYAERTTKSNKVYTGYKIYDRNYDYLTYNFLGYCSILGILVDMNKLKKNGMKPQKSYL